MSDSGGDCGKTRPRHISAVSGIVREIGRKVFAAIAVPFGESVKFHPFNLHYVQINTSDVNEDYAYFETCAGTHHRHA